MIIEVLDHEAETAGLAAIRVLMAEYAALPHTVGRWPTVAQDLAALPQPFLPPRGLLVLARTDAEPLGCAGLLALDPEIAEIKRMYVRPSARGRGLGTTLLSAVLDRAAALGFRRVRLDTAPELQVARALYQRHGFTPIPPYRSGLLPDALCFERALDDHPR